MNNNTQPTVSVSAVPFNQQTQSFSAPKTDIKAFNQQMVNASVAPTEVPKVQPLGTIETQKINLPTQPPASQPPVVNQAEQIIAQSATAETEAQKAEKSISKGILELIPQLQGQTQELATQQKALGLPEMRQNLQNINNQILQKQAELNQDEIRLAQSIQNIEDKPIAMEFITGQQQSVQRNAQIARALKASEIGVLNATALGMQGNIALAQETAKQAVETKYAPYKEALETYKLQLEALTPLLNADEKKQAREQEIKTKLAFNDIERREKNEDAANKMIIDAIPFAPSSLIARAQQLASEGKSPTLVAAALGKYAGDYLGNQLKLSSIQENKMQIAKIASEIKATQQKLPNNAVAGTDSSFYTTLANSAVNKNSLESTERESISKNISVLSQIDELEKKLSGQTTGAVAGRIRNALAVVGRDVQAGAINAQLQAIIPNLARGVYGEVGVLTDADIENYRKTLPNLTSPKEQNDAVLSMTLQSVKNNLKNKLETAASSGKDVSEFIPQYAEVVRKVNDINDRIGVNDAKVSQIIKDNPQVKPMVEELIKQNMPGSQILEALGAN